jgi:hypothetical protein
MSTDRRHRLRSAQGVGAVRALVLPAHAAASSSDNHDNDHADHNAPHDAPGLKAGLRPWCLSPSMSAEGIVSKSRHDRMGRLTAASSP